MVPNRIFSITIHPTQSKVLIAADGKWGSIGFWDVQDTESAKHGVQVIKHYSRPVNCLSFDDYDSSRLISTSYDGSACLFDINQQKSHRRLCSVYVAAFPYMPCYLLNVNNFPVIFYPVANPLKSSTTYTLTTSARTSKKISGSSSA